MFLKTLHDTWLSLPLSPRPQWVLVAVSGGADSLALLHGLLELRQKLSLTVQVATLNHMIRPEAEEDARFVAMLCQIWHVPCVVGQQDVPKLAQETRQSLETTARQVRYEFLAKIAQDEGITAIVTAHHADDQAETVLMHLIRGSGLQGLRGMQKVAPLPNHPKITLIRPLLAITRAQIEAYCIENHLRFRTDKSNLNTDYTRNAIRHTVLPTLETLNPDIRQALVRLSRVVQQETDFFEGVYTQALQAIERHPHAWRVPQDVYISWHSAVQSQFIRQAYLALNRGDKQLSWEHIDYAKDFLAQQSTEGLAELPDGWRVRWMNTDKHTKAVVVDHAQMPFLPIRYFCYWGAPISLEREREYDCGDWRLRVSRHKQDGYRARLYMSGSDVVGLRTRRTGDKFQPVGMHGRHKRLKEWFVDEKIPPTVRDCIPLITVNQQIALILLPDKSLYDLNFWHENDNANCYYLYAFFA
jgi:tRNA(Ile)-lysidine synthase